MVPIVIRGTERMMRKGSLKVVPGEVVVRFLPMVEPQSFATREELMTAVRGEMQRALETPIS